jgi:hypothetical protein
MNWQKLDNRLAREMWPGNSERPSINDIKDRTLYPLARDDIVVEKILSLLQSEPGVAVLAGPAHQGKTFAAYQVAGEIWHRWHVDPPVPIMYARAETLTTADINYIETHKELADKYRPGKGLANVYFIDDCSNGDEDFLKDIWHVAKPSTAAVLLIFRATNRRDFVQLAEHLWGPPRVTREQVLWWPERSDKFRIRVANSFIERKRRWVHPEQVRRFIKKMGKDLASLVLALEAWSSMRGASDLNIIDDEKVIEFTATKYSIDIEAKDRCKALKILAVLGMYDLGPSRKTLEDLMGEDKIGEIATLIDEGLVPSRKPGQFRYHLQDSATSEWIVRAVDRYCEVDAMTRQKILERYFRDVKKAPLALLVQAAFRRDTETIIAMLDVPELVDGFRYALSERRGSAVIHYLYLIRRRLPEGERARIGQLLSPPSIDAAIEALRGSQPEWLHKGLEVLAHTDRLREVFSSWSMEDWHRTIDQSNSRTLRRLTHNINQWNLDDANRSLSIALRDSDLEKLLTPTRSHLGEKGIAGVINNLMLVGTDAALPFLQGIAGTRFSLLLQTSEPRDVAWFLSLLFRLGRNDLITLFWSSNEAALKAVANGADWETRLWLHWNLSRGAPKAAAAMLHDLTSQSLPNIHSREYLPLLGLTRLLGLKDLYFPLPPEDVIINRLGIEKRPTELGLCLQALIRDMPPERLAAVLDRLPLDEWENLPKTSTAPIAVKEFLHNSLVHMRKLVARL